MCLLQVKYLERQMFRKTNQFTITTEVIGLQLGCRSPWTRNYNLSYIEKQQRGWNSKGNKDLKTLAQNRKKKKMRRTKFEPEATKSILVFKLAPKTQCANYLFKFKSKDLELISKVLEIQLWRKFFPVNSFSPRTAFMLTSVIKFFKKQLSKRFL